MNDYQARLIDIRDNYVIERNTTMAALARKWGVSIGRIHQQALLIGQDGWMQKRMTDEFIKKYGNLFCGWAPGERPGDKK